MGLETAIIVGSIIVASAAGASATISAVGARKEQKKQENLARDADLRAKQLADEAKKADLLAEEKARDEAIKRLRARTQTVFTTPLGLTGDAPTQKTTLGSNNTTI